MTELFTKHVRFTRQTSNSLLDSFINKLEHTQAFQRVFESTQSNKAAKL